MRTKIELDLKTYLTQKFSQPQIGLSDFLTFFGLRFLEKFFNNKIFHDVSIKTR